MIKEAQGSSRRFLNEVFKCNQLKNLTVSGPSTSGHTDGSALSPLPLKADCTLKYLSIAKLKKQHATECVEGIEVQLTLSYLGIFIFIPKWYLNG